MATKSNAKKALALSLGLLQCSLLANSVEFSSYERPFAVDSFWNSQPVSPTFSDIGIPSSVYYPTAYTPAFSASCYLANATHTLGIIKTGPGYLGVHDRDSEKLPSEITLPHWPSEVIPATGGDAHADVIDIENRVIHSFYKLKIVNGEWTSLLYSWAPLDGRGWGDPAHFYQGGRAVGAPPCAGMIRIHEVNDGDEIFRHALAMSLTYNALSNNPGYIFPATAADLSLSSNTGKIPEGALLMLPSSFDVSKIKTPLLKKIANTLKKYGAYVVDRNYGTPYVIYSEIGAQTQSVGSAYGEHDLIRRALRMVSTTNEWLDGNGNTFTPSQNLNILSMRGPWARGFNYQPDSDKCTTSCAMIGRYDTYQQAVLFDSTDETIIQSNSSSRSVTHVSWAKPKPGYKYQLTAKNSGGGLLRIVIRDPNKNDLIVYDSKELADGQTATFNWPIDDYDFTTIAVSGVGGASSVSGTLMRIE